MLRDDDYSICNDFNIFRHHVDGLCLLKGYEEPSIIPYQTQTLPQISSMLKFKEEIKFTETPLGIITSRGEWFHITRDLLEQKVPNLFEEIPFKVLVSKSLDWVDSSRQITTILTMSLALYIDPYLALLSGILFYFWWDFNKSAFAGKWTSYIIYLLTRELIPVLLSVWTLSQLGQAGEYAAMSALFIFFLLLRFRVMRKLSQRLYDRFTNYKLTLNDRVILMLSYKLALSEGLQVPAIQGMQQAVFDIVTRRKGKK